MQAAVIGVGYLGRFHAQKYAVLKGVELVGVCDSNPQQADKVAQQLQTRAFYDYQQLISLVDCVSIVLPTQLHFQVAQLFLDNGVHVLLEKPITTTVAQAQILIDIAQKNQLVLQVGHLERFNPVLLALAKVLDNPNFIEIHRLASFNTRGTDVNVVLDLMIHDIDIIQSLLKCEIKDIQAIGVPVLTKQIDICNARIRFDNGCVVNVSASRVSNKSERKMRIFQKNKYLIVDFQERTLTIFSNQNPVDGMPNQSSIQSEIITFDNADAIMEEIIAFTQAIQNHTPPIVSGEDGKLALLTALKITQETQQ